MIPCIIALPVVHADGGNLTAIEGAAIPFPIARVFTISDVPAGGRRGGHAHHKLQEVVIAVSGSFDVVTTNAKGRHRWTLNRPDRGVYVPPDVWRYLGNFSSNATALVLASTPYDPDDYIRDEAAFLASLPPVETEGYEERQVKAWKEGGLEAMQRVQR
jgi:uncharacterized RmlC-like cupin family protein